jgi:Concanavalin A-like lectin/glucanases superfamily/Bacterial TSP3 repeat
MKFSRLIAVSLALNNTGSAAPPVWWADADYPVIVTGAPPENLAVANVGQAKTMALLALEALRKAAPMIATQVESDLVGDEKPIRDWEIPATDEERADQHAPLLLGQLKAIAAPFYSRINALAPAWLANERLQNHMPDTGTCFPWTSTAADDTNRSPATIGQLKSVFSLRFETLEASLNPDLDGDGLTNADEAELGTDPLIADTDGDSILDGDEFVEGTDPLAANVEAISPEEPAPPTDPILAAEYASNFRRASDGKGLPKWLDSGLVGRWDFEVLNDPSGNLPSYFDDKSGGGRPASAYGVQVSNDAFLSRSAFHPFRNFSAIPQSLITGLKNRNTYTVSFWAAVTPDSIGTFGPGSTNTATGLFAHHRYLNIVTPYAKSTIDMNGIWLQKNGSQITLRAGSYIYNSRPSPTSPPSSVTSGVSVNMPQGTLDDGLFHHYVMAVSGAKVTLYLDGEKIGQSSNFKPATIIPDMHASVSVGRLYGPSPAAAPNQINNVTGLIGKIDRLRVWKRVINQSGVTSLYHQDIDGDGLWDITEARTLLWRDNNHNGIVDPGEKTYICDPFVKQAQGTDTDDDGLTDLQEQNLGTNVVNPDSDGDLMPDGWERHNGLNPLNPQDATLDHDDDNLNNLNEYRHGSNPHNADTDGDGTQDGTEARGADGNLATDDGSNPNDDRDGGMPLPPESKITLLLGIGDKSGSKSEDYVMNVFRIDPITGSEVRIYTLRSGGFGKYKEETRSFSNEDTLTFQIDWQGTNNDSVSASSGTPADGPDFDYTFKVQPQSGDYTIRVYPFYDPSTGTVVEGFSLLGDKNNVTDFLVSTEPNRAMVQSVKVDLAVDTNMNGIIESLPDGANNLSLTPSGSTADRDLSKSKPDYAVVIDVNNNNTDANNATSPTKGQADHLNSRLDTEDDLKEIRAATNGHFKGQEK